MVKDITVQGAPQHEKILKINLVSVTTGRMQIVLCFSLLTLVACGALS